MIHFRVIQEIAVRARQVKTTAAFGASTISRVFAPISSEIASSSSATSEYTASLALTISGHYRMLVGGLSGAGFLGVYYKDARCRYVQRAQVDSNIDFSWGTGPAVAGAP